MSSTTDSTPAPALPEPTWETVIVALEGQVVRMGPYRASSKTAQTVAEAAKAIAEGTAVTVAIEPTHYPAGMSPLQQGRMAAVSLLPELAAKLPAAKPKTAPAKTQAKRTPPTRKPAATKKLAAKKTVAS